MERPKEETFPEVTFLYSLIAREEDCKKFTATFLAEWFQRAECGVVFSEIKKFLEKYLIPPSTKTLRKVLKNVNEESYQSRLKGVLDEIDDYAKDPDDSEIAWTLDRAQDVATVRAFRKLTEDPELKKAIEDIDGTEILKQLQKLQKKFEGVSDRKTMNIREAVESLVQSDGFTPTLQRIPTGITVIDQWCGGGLRPKQLGIVVGVTGHGKSATLVNIADKMSRNEDRKVWLVTNELSLPEVTERFLTRFSGVNINDIMESPAMGLGKLKRQWKMNRLSNKLFITEYVRPPISTNDIEDELIRNRNLYGFMPEVLVLDFMERMKPNPGRGGLKSDNEWSQLQHIAQDLISLAKRHNLVVWTAVQTNRSGASADDINITHIQSSIRHVQEATACIALRQRKIVDGGKSGKVGIQFFNLKQRQSALSFGSVTLEADLSLMNITNKEATVLSTDQPVDESGQQTLAPLPTSRLTAQAKRDKQKR